MLSAAGDRSQRPAAAEGAHGQEAHGAAVQQCGHRHATEVGETMCEFPPTQQGQIRGSFITTLDFASTVQ